MEATSPNGDENGEFRYAQLILPLLHRFHLVAYVLQKPIKA